MRRNGSGSVHFHQKHTYIMDAIEVYSSESLEELELESELLEVELWLSESLKELELEELVVKLLLSNYWCLNNQNRWKSLRAITA